MSKFQVEEKGDVFSICWEGGISSDMFLLLMKYARKKKYKHWLPADERKGARFCKKMTPQRREEVNRALKSKDIP